MKYSYDAVGNRITMNQDGTTTKYSYDSANELVKAGNTSYTYDANGNQVKEDGSQGKITYSYSTSNQLTGVAYEDGSFAKYGYDALGRKVTREALNLSKMAANTTVTGDNPKGQSANHGKGNQVNNGKGLSFRKISNEK